MSRADWLSSVAGSTAAVDFPDLPAYLAKKLEEDAVRMATLSRANEERAAAFRAAVHRAADVVLTRGVRELTPQDEWNRRVWDWICANHAVVGLDGPPSGAAFRRAMSIWKPPTGDSRRGMYNGIKFNTEG